MKTLEFDDELPGSLLNLNHATVSGLMRQARRHLKFVNYVPNDASLGDKAPTEILQPERLEKEQGFRIEKMVRAFYADTRVPLKIIPKKATLDLETKLKPVMERLKLRTEMGIVSILKEQLDDRNKERDEYRDEFDGKSMENGASSRGYKGTTKHDGIFNGSDEAAEIVKQRRLQAIEENPVIKENKMFEEVLWVDELESEAPDTFKGDLVSGIQLMERLNQDLRSDSEDD